jgi:hypothetical protein
MGSYNFAALRFVLWGIGLGCLAVGALLGYLAGG